jgi:hypothetical protein
MNPFERVNVLALSTMWVTPWPCHSVWHHCFTRLHVCQRKSLILLSRSVNKWLKFWSICLIVLNAKYIFDNTNELFTDVVQDILGGTIRSYSCTTSALDGCEWSASRPGRALPPGKGPPKPIGQEAGWAPEPVWTQKLEEKSFCLCRGSNLDRPVVQSVVKTLYWLSYPDPWI